MEQNINEKAVWQRVSAAAENPRDPVGDVMLRAIDEGKVLYGQLQNLSSGKGIFPELMKRQREEVQTLRGIYTMLWGNHSWKDPKKELPEGNTYREKLRHLLQRQEAHLETLAMLKGRLRGYPEKALETLLSRGTECYLLLIREYGK